MIASSLLQYSSMVGVAYRVAKGRNKAHRTVYRSDSVQYTVYCDTCAVEHACGRHIQAHELHKTGTGCACEGPLHFD